MSILSYIVPAVIGLLLIAATMLRRDLWPFSHYPMFAGYKAPRTMRYFRLEFILPDGSSVALVAVDANLDDEFDRELSGAWPIPQNESTVRVFILRCWHDAARLRPALRNATQAQVKLRLAHLGTVHGVNIAETVVHVERLTNATA